MQAPAPAKPNYGHITRHDLNILIAALVPLKQAYDQAVGPQNQQQGGFKRGVSPQIARPYENKKKEIVDKLKDDTDAIDALCNTHAVYIQSLLDKSKVTLTSATKAVDVY